MNLQPTDPLILDDETQLKTSVLQKGKFLKFLNFMKLLITACRYHSQRNYAIYSKSYQKWPSAISTMSVRGK